MAASDEILRLIPHRPPFLWVDRIITLDLDRIEAQTDLAADLPLLQGHYPHHPIMPGVLLCEAVFQAGALLIAHRLEREGKGAEGIPVLTRILQAKFKREVGPGQTIGLQARLAEQVGPAWFMKGKVLCQGATAVSVEFACTLKTGG